MEMLPSGSNEFDSHYLNAPFPLHNMQTTKNVLTECNERLCFLRCMVQLME